MTEVRWARFLATVQKFACWRMVALLAVTLVAFVLRIYRLDAQSLWGDEGWAVYHASQGSAARVIAEAYDAGNHPPLYFLNLALWMDVTGRSEFSLRYLSLIFSVLTVPGMYVLGRRVGGRGVGLLGASLQTVAPFAVYYGQEARMYAQEVLFVVLSTYFFVRLSRHRERRPLLVGFGYIVTTSAAGYSHLFAWPVVLAQGLYWVGDLAVRRTAACRVARRCAAAQLAATIAFAPWLVITWDRLWGLSSQVEGMGAPLGTIVTRCLSDFSASVPVIAGASIDLPVAVLTLFLLLLGLGVIWPWRWRAVPLLVLGVSIPILVIHAISFPILPGWTRYFVAASPFYYLLLARGGDGLVRLALTQAKSRIGLLRVVPATLLIGLAIGLQARMLFRYYADPAYYRWDYRSRIGELADAAASGDAVVLQGKSVMFEYYYPSDVSYFTVPSICDTDEGRIRSEITDIAASHAAVWLVGQRPSHCDPNQRASQWLKENGYEVSENWMENMIFDYFLTPSELRTKPLVDPVRFDGHFELTGYGLSRASVTRGGALAVALQWRALESMPVDYKFFLVLLGPDGAVYALHDGMPLNWLWPTSRWQPGEVVDDRWGLQVQFDAPPGNYWLYLGAYDPATGARIPVLAPKRDVRDNALLLADVVVK